jgi:hypothetical protein
MGLTLLIDSTEPLRGDISALPPKLAALVLLDSMAVFPFDEFLSTRLPDAVASLRELAEPLGSPIKLIVLLRGLLGELWSPGELRWLRAECGRLLRGVRTRLGVE